MTTCTVHDVGMHLIRQRGPSGDPEFIAAYLAEEVDRRTERRLATWANLSRSVWSSLDQLEGAIAGLTSAFARAAKSWARVPNRDDFTLAGD